MNRSPHPDDILVQDLALDALKFMERAVNSLSDELQTRTMAGVAAGGQMEVRVRMTANAAPRISLVLIGDKGEIELAAGGGTPR